MKDDIHAVYNAQKGTLATTKLLIEKKYPFKAS